MEITPLVQPTLRELFERAIVHMIISGEVSAGDRLPSERELAQKMKVSKTAVHDGLKHLERLGFVYVDRNQGTYVGNYMEQGTLETLTYIMRENNGVMDDLTVSSILELRLAVQSIALPNFSKSCTAEDIRVLEEIVERIKQLEEQSETSAKVQDVIVEEFFDFYQYIFSHCGNNVFPLLFNAFKEVSILFWKNSIRKDGISKNIGHLERMVEFVNKQNMEGAFNYTYNNYKEFLIN